MPFPLPYELGNAFLMDEEIQNAWSRAIECATVLVGEELSTNPNNWSKGFQNVVWSKFLMEIENINTLYLIVKNSFSRTIIREQEPVPINKYINDTSGVVLLQYQEHQQSSLAYLNSNNNNVSNNHYHSNMSGGTNKLSSPGIIGKG
ncbi:hypothetical protein INT45_003108 [Circinella minor]|uniref:Uncharacterized protein n=1 Tax=Circinella minor TaxID=1195481 RepID=A0A8H7V3I3_9FUNG|nr:hypothetical protein INT45_003108 [Circinella minor]